MNRERDKFLTEYMGEPWMEINNNGFYHWCNDFSTWEGFGKLRNWLLSEEAPYELYQSIIEINEQGNFFELVAPDAFADFIYEFLTQECKK